MHNIRDGSCENLLFPTRSAGDTVEIQTPCGSRVSVELPQAAGPSPRAPRVAEARSPGPPQPAVPLPRAQRPSLCPLPPAPGRRPSPAPALTRAGSPAGPRLAAPLRQVWAPGGRAQLPCRLGSATECERGGRDGERGRRPTGPPPAPPETAARGSAPVAPALSCPGLAALARAGSRGAPGRSEPEAFAAGPPPPARKNQPPQSRQPSAGALGHSCRTQSGAPGPERGWGEAASRDRLVGEPTGLGSLSGRQRVEPPPRPSGSQRIPSFLYNRCGGTRTRLCGAPGQAPHGAQRFGHSPRRAHPLPRSRGRRRGPAIGRRGITAPQRLAPPAPQPGRVDSGSRRSTGGLEKPGRPRRAIERTRRFGDPSRCWVAAASLRGWRRARRGLPPAPYLLPELAFASARLTQA
ncbi:translation initiation factor IF-2-like [Oryx dammah]|uniref:translation initiation factor IF-2-like n=1 Tax=Oryx dammah TaxID=59534 RepID=UPI001A9B7404|nr:translation initiation factor IF-2-like [Oryx dammah]